MSENINYAQVLDKMGLVDFFKKLTDKELETLVAKNHDYAGEQNEKSHPLFNLALGERLGIGNIQEGILWRLSDKYARLINFTKNKNLKVKSESVLDTIQDARNYLILLAYSFYMDGIITFEDLTEVNDPVVEVLEKMMEEQSKNPSRGRDPIIDTLPEKPLTEEDYYWMEIEKSKNRIQKKGGDTPHPYKKNLIKELNEDMAKLESEDFQ